MDRLRAALEDRPDVAFAYLYGLPTGGGRHGRSDLDVAVFLARNSSRTMPARRRSFGC